MKTRILFLSILALVLTACSTNTAEVTSRNTAPVAGTPETVVEVVETESEDDDDAPTEPIELPVEGEGEAVTETEAEATEEVMEKEEGPAVEPATDPAPEAATPSSYTVNTADSIVKWVGKKMVGSGHNGTVNIKSGTVTEGENGFEAIEAVLDMNTISCHDAPSATGHLKNEDFFDVEGHPTATIKSTSITKKSETTYAVVADLTIKGITNSIAFDATYLAADAGFQATASFAIDRTKWNITYGSGSFFDDLGDKAIEDQIDFTVTLFANENA